MSRKATVLPFSKRPASEAAHFVRDVFEQHHNALRHFILRLGMSEQNSRDITQEVYLRLVRQNDPEKLKNAPRTYLYTIATNLVRDQIRKNRRQMEEQHISDQEISLPTGEPPPEAAADTQRKLDRLKQALMELPDKKRRTLLLNQYRGLSCRQIAEQTGMSFGTVQRYLSEALRYCKSKLRDQHEGLS